MAAALEVAWRASRAISRRARAGGDVGGVGDFLDQAGGAAAVAEDVDGVAAAHGRFGEGQLFGGAEAGGEDDGLRRGGGAVAGGEDGEADSILRVAFGAVAEAGAGGDAVDLFGQVPVAGANGHGRPERRHVGGGEEGRDGDGAGRIGVG